MPEALPVNHVAASVMSVNDDQSSKLLDLEAIRNDFPALSMKINGQTLAYLDNAATTQKPEAMIEAVSRFYRYSTSNVHRGVHALSECASALYEDSRKTVADFLHVSDPTQIVFVRGATEGINLVAATWGRSNLKPGDEILVSEMEHHANIVPWQLICQETGAVLKVAPIDDKGELAIEQLDALAGSRTRLLALSHVSNALGTINPVGEIISKMHRKGIPVLIDGAQAVPHFQVDVEKLDADFYVFSGHKVFGPSGIGVLYAKRKFLDSMPPYQGGGDMILEVSFEKTTYSEPPHKFEAGTPNIEGAVGLAAALNYLKKIGPGRIEAHEKSLLDYAVDRLQSVKGLRLIGQAARRAGSISFVVDGVHPHDMGAMLDAEGIAVRVGHHCAQPVMKRFGVPATTRASLAFYNTKDEIDRLVMGVKSAKEFLG